MTSDQLTTDQAAKLGANIGRSLGYLNRLRARMEQRHFPPNDKLYQLVTTAADAMHALNVELHYRSCSGGATYVWRL